MPDDKIVSIDRRLADLETEAEQEAEAPRDLVITVCYVKTIIDANGTRREVPVRYREEDYAVEDCGQAVGGGRHLVRKPRADAVPLEDGEDAASGNVCPWPKDATADS